MATPSELTFLRTTRDTADPISQDKPLDIGAATFLHNPEKTQAFAWMMANGRPARKTYNHTFGHREKGPFSNWVQFSGADESTQLTDGITIDNVQERCAEGQMLLNTRTLEVMRLTADPDAADTTQEVARNQGRGASTDLMKTGDALLLLTPQMYEGFTMGKPQSGVGVYKSFTTGIISAPVAATQTEDNEKYYDGTSPFERDLFDSWDRVNAQLEAAMFFMAQTTDSTTYAQNYHTMSGLYDFIQTNVFDVSNIYLSRLDFLDIVMAWEQWYHGPGAIICSSYMRAHITELAYNKMEMVQSAETLGMNIRQVELNGKMYPLLTASFLDTNEYLRGTVFFCPEGHFQYRWLEERENHDLHYNPVNRDEVHKNEGEIWGEIGYEFFAEEDWAMITGMQF